MIKIEPERKALVSLEQAQAGELMKRYDLRELIFSSPDVFFKEIGERLFLIGKNVELSQAVPIRIDLLALDESGQAVIVIVQRGQEQSLLPRAITCVGLIASWKPADFFGRLSEDQAGRLRSFLEVRPEEINQGQRTILMSEAFDFEVLAATKWLWERSRMDNTCVRILLVSDRQTGAEYLECTDESAERETMPGVGMNGKPAGLPPERKPLERPLLPNAQQPALSALTDRPTVISG